MSRPARARSATHARLIFYLSGQMNLDLLTPDTQRYGSLLVLLDGDVQKGRTYTYRVSAVTKDNQEGAVSAPVAADMLASPQPAVLKVDQSSDRDPAGI